jgi:hypothetical protein
LSLAVVKASLKLTSILFGGYLALGHSPDPISADIPKYGALFHFLHLLQAWYLLNYTGRYFNDSCYIYSCTSKIFSSVQEKRMILEVEQWFRNNCHIASVLVIVTD